VNDLGWCGVGAVHDHAGLRGIGQCGRRGCQVAQDDLDLELARDLGAGAEQLSQSPLRPAYPVRTHHELIDQLVQRSLRPVRESQ
jgi:hypothetical protein